MAYSASVRMVQKIGTDQTTFPAATYRMFDASGISDYDRNFLTSHQYYRLSPTVRDAIAADMAPGPNV